MPREEKQNANANFTGLMDAFLTCVCMGRRFFSGHPRILANEP
jgi:hypothetical protein